ncbi:MAG: hypothetical protein ACYDCL_08390 [Myxococcales bacterium]
MSADGNADDDFALLKDGNNLVEWVFDSGNLFATYFVGGTQTNLATLSYSSTSDAWWRIRESSGTVYWDTSSDGVSWTSQASVADSSLFDLSSLTPTFYCETYGTGSPSPGQAEFANLSIPPTSALVDSFSFSAVDTAMWNPQTNAGGTVTEGLATLNLKLPANNSLDAQAAVWSNNLFDLTGSSISVEAPQTITSGGNADEDFAVMIDRNNSVGWYLDSGTLSAIYIIGGTQTVLTSLTYAPPPYTYLYWRIREDSGAVYWDTSSDGSTWTNQASVADSALFSLQACTVELYSETYGNLSSSTEAQFSNLNYQ